MTVKDHAALARKRRCDKLRAAQHHEGIKEAKRARLADDSDEDEDVSYDDDDASLSYPNQMPSNTPSIRGIKRQTRYEPGVPMTREQLSVWRKEARRVRNRESAAQSRQKTRERIEQLEEQVNEVSRKYEAALQRILELEGHKSKEVQNVSPDILSEDLADQQRRGVVSPANTPSDEGERSIIKSLPSFTLQDIPSDRFVEVMLQTRTTKVHPKTTVPSDCLEDNLHPTMISRPTAV